MSITMYQASVPTFIRMLGNLKGILEKAAAHAAAKKIDESVFLNARLSPDMFPFTRQVHIATDFARGTGARLSGLESPTGKLIERGDPLTTAVGYWGGLSSRVGWVVEDQSELPSNAADYVEKLAMPYFACAAEWYATIGIGISGGALDAIARKHLGAPFFNLILNPGHLIHLDEWMNTPIYPNSTETLRSGQAIQCDIIPAVGPPYHSANIEDGIALLDERGRAELREKYPDVADRADARRAFMADVLGIVLKPEVVPLSNLAAALPPFLLAPNRLLAIR